MVETFKQKEKDSLDFDLSTLVTMTDLYHKDSASRSARADGRPVLFIGTRSRDEIVILGGHPGHHSYQ